MSDDTAPSSEPTSLAGLRPGSTAVVRSVLTQNPGLRDRMRAMGLCEGRRLHALRTGSRIIVMTMGTRIGLSRQLAASVMVDVQPDGGAQS